MKITEKLRDVNGNYGMLLENYGKTLQDVKGDVVKLQEVRGEN